MVFQRMPFVVQSYVSCPVTVVGWGKVSGIKKGIENFTADLCSFGSSGSVRSDNSLQRCTEMLPIFAL